MYGGKFAFQNRLGQLVVGRKFTSFALFTLYSRANPSTRPPGSLYSEGRFNGRFFALRFRGAYIWRGYTWRGLFSEFYGIPFIIFVGQFRDRNNLTLGRTSKVISVKLGVGVSNPNLNPNNRETQPRSRPGRLPRVLFSGFSRPTSKARENLLKRPFDTKISVPEQSIQ